MMDQHQRTYLDQLRLQMHGLQQQQPPRCADCEAKAQQRQAMERHADQRRDEWVSGGSHRFDLSPSLLQRALRVAFCAALVAAGWWARGLL